MAHQITTRADNFAEMAYTGETPWHGLGQKLEENAPIEQWITSAGMDYTVRKTKIQYYADRAENDLRVDPDFVALVRSDNGERLGIVGEDYQIVQPFEVLEFFRDLVKDAGFKLHTAGTLFGGKRYWALAQLEGATIAGWDKVGGYYLLSTTADGTRATEGRETTVRVVCNNTLSMALSHDLTAHGFRLSHRERFEADKILQKQLGLAQEHFHKFMEAANGLSKIKCSLAGADEFLMKLLASKPVEGLDDEANPRRPKGIDSILALFEGAGRGAEQKGSKGTMWGLLNSVTEYVDHFATAKTLDHRLDRAMWGTGDRLKTEAFMQALELV